MGKLFCRLIIKRAAPPEKLWSETKITEEIHAFLQSASRPLIVITGPTASGKTALSIQLARMFDGEIVNADSRQFYRGMDIGTAKVTTGEMDGVPHHLLSFLEPDASCTAAEFKALAEEHVAEIRERQHLPFLVGGSGLFVDALCKNLQIPRIPPQPELRAELNGLDDASLFAKLLQADPTVAARIHPHNRPRLVRALEIIALGGTIQGDIQDAGQPQWDVFKIGVWTDPEELNIRIEKRTEAIWQAGFLDEVQALQKAGFAENTPALIAHGYREAIRFLKGEITEAEAKEQMTLNTRRYAKRQRTWWRRDAAIRWVEIETS